MKENVSINYPHIKGQWNLLRDVLIGSLGVRSARHHTTFHRKDNLTNFKMDQGSSSDNGAVYQNRWKLLREHWRFALWGMSDVSEIWLH